MLYHLSASGKDVLERECLEEKSEACNFSGVQNPGADVQEYDIRPGSGGESANDNDAWWVEG